MRTMRSKLLETVLLASILMPTAYATDRLSVAKGGGFAINQGIAGAWLNQETPGQGFLIDIDPGSNFIFIAWFTYESLSAKIGAPEHRWLTAQGNYSGNSAEIPIFLTSGGAFNSSQSTSTDQVGTLTITFDDCATGTVDYALDEGLSNQFEIERLLPMGQALCQSLGP